MCKKILSILFQKLVTFTNAIYLIFYLLRHFNNFTEFLKDKQISTQYRF